MNPFTNEELLDLIQKATAGDKPSLETVMLSVQDLVFNLSLRMLGTFPDAEDASQDILLKVMTHLSSFKGESAFSTWVFRIAVNHLKDYKKHMFAQFPLSFEFYGDDIQNARTEDVPDLTQNVEQAILAEELKLSCTNVMLQCLDTESRCIFILGTMFHVDSRIAGDILGITPEAYRQRLSRVRKKMADFLGEYCGEYGKGNCRCADRVNYAIQNHRIHPAQLYFQPAAPAQVILDVKEAMEEIDDLSQEFSFCRTYQSPENLKQFIKEFLNGASFSVVGNSQETAGSVYSGRESAKQEGESMDTQLILRYLKSLSENNNREWYHAHKAAYKEANAQFEELVQELILQIGKFDRSILPGEAKELTFKLVRDTRFSHDKSPYHPAFRAHIGPGGKLPVPVGYYLMIKPGGQSFLGGGLFAASFKDATSMVRDHIAANGGEWERILHDPGFQKEFSVQGTALKNVPAGYDKEHPQAEYLKFKSWYLEYPVSDDMVADGERFLAEAVRLFRIMKPFNDFLNQALKDFQMPAR